MSKYVSRTFPKKVLQDLLREDLDEEGFEGKEMEVVEDEIYDNSRWSAHHRLIFSHGKEYYQVDYTRGATENQPEMPFEYASQDVVCIKVEAKPVTIVKFVPIIK